jgi:hypothetical protein
VTRQHALIEESLKATSRIFMCPSVSFFRVLNRPEHYWRQAQLFYVRRRTAVAT